MLKPVVAVATQLRQEGTASTTADITSTEPRPQQGTVTTEEEMTLVGICNQLVDPKLVPTARAANDLPKDHYMVYS